MSSKETNLKEKFRIALTSTARVISEDIFLKYKSSENKSSKASDTLEINDLTNPSDFIKLRAETDSIALKKRFSDELIYKKNLPSNSSSISLYKIAEKIRCELLGGKMLKGIEKNFNENYNQIINNRIEDHVKSKDDVSVLEAFELYMLKNFHQIHLNPITTKILSFWEKDFQKSIDKHKSFLKENVEDQNNYSLRFSKIFEEMDIFQTDENEKVNEENQDQGQNDQ